MADFLTISGLEDLQAKLKELTGSEMESTVRASVFAGAALIREQAIVNAPEWPEEIKNQKHPPAGTLKKSIIVKRLDELATNGSETYGVMVRTGRKDGDLSHDAYYAMWVEYGHFFVPKNPNIKISRRGIVHSANWKGHRAANRNLYVVPHPFMRPAFESKNGAAVKEIQERLLAKIEEVAGD